MLILPRKWLNLNNRQLPPNLLPQPQQLLELVVLVLELVVPKPILSLLCREWAALEAWVPAVWAEVSPVWLLEVDQVEWEAWVVVCLILPS